MIRAEHHLYKSPEVKNATFVAYPGIYRIECWGAQGCNSANGGCGAYVAGTIRIHEKINLYIYVGDKGHSNINENAYNGGGVSQFGSGGASDVRLTGGDWSLFESLKSRIIVAAGGGGYDNDKKGGAGGELEGLESEGGYGKGGTQLKGGEGSGSGKFGCGGGNNRFGSEGDNDGNGAGGGGYFGGGASTHEKNFGGGGGSSYISGHPGCIAISEDSTSIDNIVHEDTSVHYSGKQFFYTTMIAGTKRMPSPDGNTETGHCDSGAVKITKIDFICSFRNEVTLSLSLCLFIFLFC